MDLTIEYEGKVYAFVNQKDGYTAYRCITNPRDELIFNNENQRVRTFKSIKKYWSEL